jgi:hypothetical protein
MNDLLLCGLALAALGVASAAWGVYWLATGAFVAAIPFLAVGVLLALETSRARHLRGSGPVTPEKLVG